MDLKDLPSEVEEMDDGGAEVVFRESSLPEPRELPHYANLVRALGDDELLTLATTVVEEYEADKQSRADWEQMFTKGLKLLGLKLEQLSEPFAGACSAVHPLLIENIVKFQSKAITELFPSGGPVKTEIVGKISPKLEERALRVKQFMNWELTELMPEYMDQTEKLLFALAFFGSAVKKNYYDKAKRRPRNEYVPIENFYVNNSAVDLTKAERYTHVIFSTHREYLRDVSSGMYVDAELAEPDGMPELSSIKEGAQKILGTDGAATYTRDFQHTFLEQHRYCVIDKDDPPEGSPYVVTVDLHTKKVLQVRRSWRKGDETRARIDYFTHYTYVPNPFGFYGLGMVHFLGNTALAVTVIERSMVDAGIFANLQGGFKNKSARLVGGNRVIKPGEFIDVEFAGKLGDNILPITYKEPSKALFDMYQSMVAAGQKFADSQEQVVADSTNYGPVGTTLALLDASTKFFSAVHKRLHKAQKDELGLIARLNYYWLPDEYPYDVVGGSRKVFKQDFDGSVAVIPVSDPNTPSQSQRLAKAQLVYEMTKQEAPGTIDKLAVLKYIFKAADVPNYEEILIDPEADVEERDPMTDLKAACLGKPVKAFPGQDHDAYITIFGAFTTDPQIQSNQTFAPALAILTAAIREHQLAKWLLQVESLTKAGLTASPGAVPDQVMAQAAQMVLKANQMAAQEGGGAPEMLAAQAAMMDAQTRRMKIEADQIKSAAQTAVRNREVANREKQTELDAAQAKAQFMKDVTEGAAQRQQEVALKSSDLLFKDALERDRMAAQAQEGEKQRDMEFKDRQANRGAQIMQKGADLSMQAREGEASRAHQEKSQRFDKLHSSLEAERQRGHDAEKAKEDRAFQEKALKAKKKEKKGAVQKR